MAILRDSLTTDWLKEAFLLGIDLTLDDGSPYPDTIYDQSITSAIHWLEHEIGIVIDPINVEGERHDALDLNRSAWWPLRVDRRPVLGVTSFEIKFGNYRPVTIPTSWCQVLSRDHGQIHLIPSEEALGSYLFRAGVPLMMGDTMSPYSYIPGYFQIGYRAGFEFREGSDTIPDGENEVVVTLSEALTNNDYYLDYATKDASLGRIDMINRTTAGFTLRSQNNAAAANGLVKWGATTVPADLKHIIGLRASLIPMDVAGDLISGAGVANYSIGADGVHQSLGTTSSATNCLHPETKIAMADGTLKTIESLTNLRNFKVACVDREGNAVVGNAHSARRTIEDRVIAVELSNGEEILCNKTHPFRLIGGNYVPAGELLPNQWLTHCSLVTDDAAIFVVGVRETGEKAWLYDLTVDDYECFGVGQGVIVHNSGYGARRGAFERELKALLPAIKARYRALNWATV